MADRSDPAGFSWKFANIFDDGELIRDNNVHFLHVDGYIKTEHVNSLNRCY